MTPQPHEVGEDESLVLSYSIKGDERVYEAIISALVIADVDVTDQGTVLADLIEPDVVDRRCWDQPDTYLSTEIRDHRVVISEDTLWVYERGDTQADQQRWVTRPGSTYSVWVHRVVTPPRKWGMYEISTDGPKNRLYIDLTGRMESEEIAAAAEEAVAAGETLRDGFDIINDISGFSPPSPEAAEPIKEAQRELKSLGLDRVVRVVDDETSQVVVNAFERRSRDVGYSGETASTVEEAERLLADETVTGHR